MKTRWVIFAWVCWSLCFCAGPGAQVDKETLFNEVVSAVPEYQDFLTVDELHQSLKDLKEKYPELVSLAVLAESEGYIKGKYNALAVVCELPYFYDPRIDDTTPSDLTRRQANLEGIENRREILKFLKQNYEKAQPHLLVSSLFVDAIEDYLDKGETNIATMESAVQTGEDYERQATVAEKWDALSVSKFYSLLSLGQFVRLLEHEKAERGEEFPEPLQNVLDESLEFFETKAAEVEEELNYTVVPIKKLASVQLVTALHTMDYVQNHPELSARR